jgi:hypothetical protein
MRIALTVLLLSASLFAAPLQWTAASYRGLIMGRAHRQDVVRTLGTPDASRHTAKGEELSYKTRGEHKGDLTVRLDRSGVAVEVEEDFPVAIPRTSMYKEFGKDAVTAQYSIAKCAGGALYRDPRGNIELTLYPARGIVLWPDQFGYDFAAIHYFARQPGVAARPACVPR